MTPAEEATPQPEELGLEEQIASCQREFPELDPRVEMVVAALRRLNRHLDLIHHRQIAELGISNAEWEVLEVLVLVGRPYRLGPGELARRLGLTPAAMTHRIDRLVADGLVTRERDEANRVHVNVELTDDGRATWLDARRRAAEFEGRLLRDLSPEEVAALGATLVRLLDRVEPHAG